MKTLNPLKGIFYNFQNYDPLIRVFHNFHLIYEGYFIILSFILSNLFTSSNISSCKSLFIHHLKLGQPNNLHPPKSILLYNKFIQISSIKQAVREEFEIKIGLGLSLVL